MADDTVLVIGKEVQVRINPKLYPLESIYSAAYVYTDRAYIHLDGDPEEQVVVSLIEKKKESDHEKLGNLGRLFLNELIAQADFRVRTKESKTIREMILQRALFTNDPQAFDSNAAVDELLADLENEPLDDPEGIAIPWEEKYGKGKET